MNRFFTLLLAASCLTAVGQEVDGWCCDPESSFFEGVGCEVESPLDGFVDDPDCGDWMDCIDVAACNYADWGPCNYECEGCRIPTACNYNSSVHFGNIELCLFPNGYCQECGGNPTNGQGFVTIQDSDNDGICDLDDPCVGGCLQGCESSEFQIEISLENVELFCDSELSLENQVLSALQYCPETTTDTLFVVVSDAFLQETLFYVEVTVAVINVEDGSISSITELIPVLGFLDNGECEILGCTSQIACNYDAEANSDDGSCDFVSCLDSDGLCCDQDSQNYADYLCTICNPSDGFVCDPDCSDFDPFVCQGNGGCLDENACNYDSGAAYGDDSCVYAFCAETCNGECAFTEANIYFTESVEHYDDPSFPPTEFYVPTELECFFYSDQYPSPPNGPIGELFFNGELVYEGVFNYFSTFFCGGNYVGGGGFGDLSWGSSVFGGGGLAEFGITDWNYPCGVDSLEFHFPSEACGEVVLKGVWNGEQFGYSSGCTSAYALNYSPAATCDDGTCVFEGCTDPLSCNFDAEASLDDGSCDYSCCPGPGCCSQGLFWDWELGQCFLTNPADINLDGCVQLNDLLDLLSAYGDCAAEESPWQCGDPLEYQSYDYETVQIGEQCWFAENLRATAYQDGTDIDELTANSLWVSATGPAFSKIPEHEEFGCYYNGHVVLDERTICPSGWRVSDDLDWMEMESLLGLNEVNSWCFRGIEIGTMLKSSYFEGWGAAIPGGYRYTDGQYHSQGNRFNAWSIGEELSLIRRRLDADSDQINRDNSTCDQIHVLHGFSIRCIKDAE
jgi:uncharacterized protein (TIGR02145 family)